MMMAEGRGRREESRASEIRNLPDPHFKTHFRMNRVTFEILVNVVGHERREMGLLQRVRMNVGESTVMGLWILFNMDTFRSTGLNVSYDMKTVHRQLKILLEVLCRLGDRYIKWPNQRQGQITARVEGS